MVSTSSAFDAGNIEVVEKTEDTVRLDIRADPYTELEEKQHMQWFAFRATVDQGDGPNTIRYEICNAKDASYVEGWRGCSVCASLDRETWQRVASTGYDEDRGVLYWEWTHDGPTSSVTFAYFDLYPHERHLKLIASCATLATADKAALDGLRVFSLGQSLD